MIKIGVSILPFISKVARAVADYYNRVIADGGVSESPDCVNSGMSDLDRQNLLNDASLLLIPSGYKGGKLYAEIPTNGNGDLTWTRASDAFRTNASGLIQRVPCNLFGYSEQFDNGYWYKSNSSITANTITAPNGTLTADSWIESNTNSFHVFGKSSLSLNSGSYVITIYAKAKERSKLIMLYTGTPNKGYGFDLANGTTSAVTGITSADSFSITNVGDGWYRCEIGVVSNSIGTVEFTMVTSFSVLSYLGDGTSGMYVWGAQLVEGTTAQTYLPTTDRLNFPRLSYMYGSCPSVLLEPQRTNLLTYSNTPTDSSWSKTSLGAGTAPVVTANAETSPDGTTNASRVQFNCGGTTSSDRSILRQNITIANTTNYAGTFYVKAYSSGEIGKQLRFVIEGVTSQVIITLTDSWQRVATTGASSTTSTNYLIETRGGTTTNTTADVLIYGAQFEVGAYPTTYIPTTSATATRVADSFSRNNIYTNGLITSSGGTWFFELDNNISLIRDAASNLFIGTTNNGNTNTSLGIRTNGATAQRLAIYKRISGTLTQLYLTLTDTIKVAIKWNGTTADVFVNGVKVNSATAFTTTNMEFLQGDGLDVPKYIQQMALYPSALSDTDCTTLTTL